MNKTKIKLLMQEHGITQRDLSVRCGKSIQAVNKALNDQPWEVTVLTAAVELICEKDPNTIAEELLN